jgi:hypothetical protein
MKTQLITLIGVLSLGATLQAVAGPDFQQLEQASATLNTDHLFLFLPQP